MKVLQNYLTHRFQVTDTEWQLIEKAVVWKRLEKGDYFIRQNQIARQSGLVMRGVLRYFSWDKEGDAPTCYFTYENHYILDPFTFGSKAPSGINLQAITPCDIVVIGSESDCQLREKLPRWTDITNRLLMDVSLEFATQKELLGMSAPERYLNFLKKYPGVASRVPLQFIASYLGIQQPSLSRIRRTLAKLKPIQ